MYESASRATLRNAANGDGEYVRRSGRSQFQPRELTLRFERTCATAEKNQLGGSGVTTAHVALGGGTRCLVAVTADLMNVAASTAAASNAAGSSAMKNEGSIFFDVSLGGMMGAGGGARGQARRAASAYSASASTPGRVRGNALTSSADAEEARIVLCRGLERMIREGRALDLEALSVVPGKLVWSVRCDVRVLDNCGNVAEAVSLAALAALQAHRLPDVSVDAGVGVGAPPTVTVHSSDTHETAPLPLHFVPVTVGFALLSEDGECLIADPDIEEEAASDGTIHVSMNAQGEVCGVTKVWR